jgi:hypothetical protein
MAALEKAMSIADAARVILLVIAVSPWCSFTQLPGNEVHSACHDPKP